MVVAAGQLQPGERRNRPPPACSEHHGRHVGVVEEASREYLRWSRQARYSPGNMHGACTDRGRRLTFLYICTNGDTKLNKYTPTFVTAVVLLSEPRRA